MNIASCYITNTGTARENNEDSLLLGEFLIAGVSMDQPGCLRSAASRQIYIVADGMGGHARGETASRTVLSVFKEEYKEAETADDIRGIVLSSKKRLNRLVELDRSGLGMGTTVAGIFIADKKAICFSCGDSRVYRVRDKVLEKITRDHSIVQELSDRGIITEDEMRRHPQKHLMTSSIMGDLRTDPAEVFLREMDIGYGERFLICSDGLWESVSKGEMEECLSLKNLDDAVHFLLGEALRYNAPDNVTIIGLEILSD